MYELARKTRAERRAKAERLGASTERKTDSSDWTPAEPLNADAKTGMRPVSRRAYKKGGKVVGKVEGCGAKANMGRKARKSGGKADDPRAYANAKVNRDAKDANEERAGVKHVGGLKTGGRAKKQSGGRTAIDRLRDALGLDSPDYAPKFTGNKPEAPKMDEAERARLAEMAKGDTRSRQEAQRKRGGRAKKEEGGGLVERLMDRKKPGYDIGYELRVKRSQMEQDDPSYNKGQGPTKQNAANLEYTKELERRRSSRKTGGRAKKADGGENVVERATKMLDKSAKTAGVPGTTMSFGRVTKGSMSPARAAGLKKGGKVAEHGDEAMDKALIKKMVKPEARTGKAGGGKAGQFVRGETREDRIETAKKAADLIGEKTIKKGQALGSNYTPDDFEEYIRSSKGSSIANRAFMDEINSPRKAGGRIKRKSGGAVENRTVHKTDGEFHYPEKDYGQLASTSAFTRKVQDRTPLKTGGRAKGKTDVNIIIQTGAKPGQQDGMMPPPGMDMGPPPGVPVPVPGGGPAPAAPAPMPMPMPMPMPAAGPVPGPAPMPRKRGGRAMSFKDMTAGAGSGEGRLQKTDIAEYKREKRRAGGKVYKSYQDMDAGAGSGLGRLEKTEIQSRKR